MAGVLTSHTVRDAYRTLTKSRFLSIPFTYDEFINRDKTSLDITWIKDKSLADLDTSPIRMN